MHRLPPKGAAAGGLLAKQCLPAIRDIQDNKSTKCGLVKLCQSRQCNQQRCCQVWLLDPLVLLGGWAVRSPWDMLLLWVVPLHDHDPPPL